jgi:hypothetical protein
MTLGVAGAAGRRRPGVATPGMDKLAQRVKTWLQDFF